MRKSSRPWLFLCASALACSNDPTSVQSVQPTVPRSLTAHADAGGVGLSVTGSGHVMRDLGAGEELTTFSYSAIRRVDGTTSGQFQYDFRALNLVVHGTVTCVTSAGNVAWIGGVIDDLRSDDPVDQALVGTDIWWRVTDNGQGASDPADLTTSLLFTIPGVPITAASWCQDQPTRGVQRPIIRGNINIHD